MADRNVTVSSPGPAGVPGITFKEDWSNANISYVAKDVVRYTNDGNLYYCKLAHTSGSVIPTDTAYWVPFVLVPAAYEWSTTAQYSQVQDTAAGLTGYSAYHYAKQSQDWAKKTNGQVKDDAGSTNEGYSAKEWATDTDADIGSARDWATKTNGQVASTEYSAKAHAVGGTGVDNATGSAKDWATEVNGPPSSTATDASAKEWAIGASTHKNEGSAKGYATKTKHSQVEGTSEYSSKHYQEKSQDWASLTTDAVTDNAGTSDVEYSAKSWAIGGTEVSGTASRGSAKEWAAKTDGTADNAEHSSKAWAIGGTGITNTASHGASKEWATKAEDSTVDGTSYSSLHHAAKATASASSASGSASTATTQAGTSTTQAGLSSDHRADAGKYAVTAEDSSFSLTSTNGGTSGLYSALHYQAKALANASTATTQAGTATTQAGLSSDHRADAGKYAVTAEDSTFALTSTNGSTSGLYSALHYQAKAQGNQTAASGSASAASSSASAAAGSASAASASAAGAAAASISMAIALG